MKIVAFAALLAVVVPGTLTAAKPAFAQNNAPAPIKAATVGTGYANSNVTGASTTFKPSDHSLHGVLALSHIESADRYKAVWVAVDAAGLKNYVIGEFTPPKFPANTIHAKLEMPRDFPVGKYRVDWMRDNKLVRSAPFVVK